MSSAELQTVAVRTEPAPTVLGGTVNAVITITGEPDRKVKGAKVQLVRTAIHRVTQTNVTDHGSHDSLLQEAVVIAEVPIGSADGPVVPGEQMVSLHIPADGLPSATDQVRWLVRAIIDRRHGVDIKAESPIVVLAGPERFASEATSEARYKGERSIDLELSTRTLRPGDSVTGNVILRPARAIRVTEVVVTFAVTLPAKKGLEGTAVAPQILLTDQLDLWPGDTKRLPFELTLPADAAPTVRGSLTTPPCHSIISWDIGAEAKSVLPGDNKTEANAFAYLGINVYNADTAEKMA
jgi:SpoOM protein